MVAEAVRTGQALGKGNGDHGADHVAGEGEPGQSPKDADGDEYSADELGQAVDVGEELGGFEVIGLEVDRLAVDARLVKGAKERAGAVVDEDPGEARANEQKNEVTGLGAVAGLAEPVGDLFGARDQSLSRRSVGRRAAGKGLGELGQDHPGRASRGSHLLNGHRSTGDSRRGSLPSGRERPPGG